MENCCASPKVFGILVCKLSSLTYPFFSSSQILVMEFKKQGGNRGLKLKISDFSKVNLNKELRLDNVNNFIRVY